MTGDSSLEPLQFVDFSVATQFSLSQASLEVHKLWARVRLELVQGKAVPNLNLQQRDCVIGTGGSKSEQFEGPETDLLEFMLVYTSTHKSNDVQPRTYVIE